MLREKPWKIILRKPCLDSKSSNPNEKFMQKLEDMQSCMKTSKSTVDGLMTLRYEQKKFTKKDCYD